VSVQRYGEWDGFRLLGAVTNLICFQRAVTDSYSLLAPETPQPTQPEGSVSTPSMDYIQGSRHMLEMTRNLFDEVAEEGAVRYQRVDKQLASVSMIRNGEMGCKANRRLRYVPIAQRCYFYVPVVQVANQEGEAQQNTGNVGHRRRTYGESWSPPEL
jgi:hypothetical protein